MVFFQSADEKYQITGVIRQSHRSIVYRGQDGGKRPVVLKVLTRQHGPADLERLMNEYTIGTKLGISSVVKPISIQSTEGLPALVTEDFGGESLDRYVGEPMEVGRFLRLAVQIAAATAEIHEMDFIHKDLKAENILV